jgi:hypothetical protein
VRPTEGQCLGATMKNLLKNDGMSVGTKIILKALSWPVVVDGCESLANNKGDKAKISGTKTKCL